MTLHYQAVTNRARALIIERECAKLPGGRLAPKKEGTR
jgi:hypothetical protein